MPQERIKKLYYSIGEVSVLTGLEKHVLRYWETEFTQLEPRKNRAGRRVYTVEDIALVRRIQYLLKEAKYTLEGARQVMLKESNPSDDEKTIREQMSEMREFLTELLRSL